MYANEIIFGLSKSKKLAENVSKITNIRLGKSHLNHFADGEILFTTDEVVRGADIFLIQATSNPVNDSLMELLIAIDALKRASVNSITLIIPYFGYSRQDRKASGREPITSKLIADMLEKAGATKILTIDIHSPQQQGFFSVPFDSMTAIWLLLNELTFSKDNSNYCIVSPDYGSVKRTRMISEKLDAGFAIVDKKRPSANVVVVNDLLGEVANKDCIMVDDMIDTGGTVLSAAKLLKEKGAKSVSILATHGLFNSGAKEKFELAYQNKIIDNLYCTDSIEVNKNIPNFTKIISIKDLVADAITVFKSEEVKSLGNVYKNLKYYDIFN